MEDTSVTGKLLLKGQIKIKTPLIIGSGEKNSDVDITLLKDSAGNPYIPATSFAGVLRHYFYEHAEIEENEKEQLRYFWGDDDERKETSICQSALFISDLTSANKSVIKIRDGVAIDNKKGIAKEGKKYDYEVLEPGALFNLKMEITFRSKTYDKQIFVKILAFLIKALKENYISVGAMTTKGFGRCKLINEEIYELDFNRKEDVIALLSGDMNLIRQGCTTIDINDTYPMKTKEFTIESLFEIKNSLIVRAYSGDPLAPDAMHILSNGHPVLPGTSIKGAIRSRAVRIINTLGSNGEELIKRLFGWVDDEGVSKEKYKSRVIIEEEKISNIASEIQSRIKIDRFTGGVIKTALFEIMPLWPVVSDKEMVSIKIRIKNYDDWEAGLLLLVLKDLWNADLPIGGEKSIGRGVLKGIQANISFGEKISISAGINNKINLSGSAEKLEYFVQAFLAKCKEMEVFNVL
ncbi:RAMP superfamily CRISPR-associated protein [Desulfolucanica intricata]|uniref:RAMP superfamily CRISPR-associated protein n=1 Tax=Desulfolucanica intricata TaxID=1285191 RepID=UPI0008369883|nr:RAMP superfamily CRISPR-associated protein [Desulfolucanica intricata]